MASTLTLKYFANATGTQSAASLATSLLNAFNGSPTTDTSVLTLLGGGSNFTIASATKSNTGTVAKLTVTITGTFTAVMPNDNTTPFNDLYTGQLSQAIGQPVLGQTPTIVL